MGNLQNQCYCTAHGKPPTVTAKVWHRKGGLSCCYDNWLVEVEPPVLSSYIKA